MSSPKPRGSQRRLLINTCVKVKTTAAVLASVSLRQAIDR